MSSLDIKDEIKPKKESKTPASPRNKPKKKKVVKHA